MVSVLALLLIACGSPVDTAAHGSPSASTTSSASLSTPTPSGSPAAGLSSSPSPPAVVAANLTCRLPVTSAATGGWVTFPGGAFVSDPAGLTMRQETVPSYDRAIGAWVPVEPEKVAPDGASYVLTSYNSTPPFSVVDARTGRSRLILPVEREGPIQGSAWKVVQYASEGIYLWTGNGGMEMPVPGLWLLNPETGGVRLVDGSHYWGKVQGGVAWALDEPNTRASASKVYRLDLGTGEVSTVYESKTDIRLLSPTPDGEMLIDYGKVGSPQLALLAWPGSFVPIGLPPAFPPIYNARLAKPGVWLAVFGEAWSGIALYLKGEGVTIMARNPDSRPGLPGGLFYDAAGDCL
jgi:hypothetical protein